MARWVVLVEGNLTPVPLQQGRGQRHSTRKILWWGVDGKRRMVGKEGEIVREEEEEEKEKYMCARVVEGEEEGSWV